MSLFTSTARKTTEPRPGKKYFSLAEAMRALPLIKRIAADVQVAQAERLRLHGELSAGLGALTTVQQERLQAEFERATDRLESYIEELGKIGVDLKDPTRALLDFPAVFEGREVLLCWKSDEVTIARWHEVKDGFAGRKPISLLSK
jgi:hypothetical protein